MRNKWMIFKKLTSDITVRMRTVIIMYPNGCKKGDFD
jgi:hypothetical protein